MMDQLTGGQMDQIPSLCSGFKILGWATCVPNFVKIGEELWVLECNKLQNLSEGLMDR